MVPCQSQSITVVLEVLQRLGAGVECAFPAEIGLARKSGFSNDRIIYHSPSATEEMAISVLRSGGTVIVDSKEFLVNLDSRLGLNKSLCNLTSHVNSLTSTLLAFIFMLEHRWTIPMH